MASNRQPISSDLFQPLTGQEHDSRLEEKFAYYLDSDDETEASVTSNQTKTSRLGNGTDVPLKWLNSQKGTSSVIRGIKRVQQKRKRLNQHNSCEQEKYTTVVEKPTRKQQDASFSKTLVMSSSAREDVNIMCSTQDTEVNMEETSVSHTTGYYGVSESHEERPKLTITPTSDRVGYQLSTDDVQPSVIVPATINQYLRDYQREGIHFLYQHYVAQTGAILGDDMGLGKTIQVIGFLAALLGKQGNQMDSLHNIPKFIRQMSDDIPSSPPKQAQKPFLIIGPSAVMYNWLDELQTWGYFSASKFHGVDKETCLDNLKKGKLEVVVTTFETFRDNTTTLNQVDWEAVIVDEVHKIKGLKAQITHALRTVKSPCRFGLTGTVLQNNMSELWSLFDWVQPGILGTLEQFETEFIQAIEQGQRHDATKRELAQARKKKDAFSNIRKKLMLRRTKALIADQLPSKEDMVVMCRLSDMQISVYKAVLSHPDMQLVLYAEDPCDCRSQKARASCCYKKSSSGRKAWTLVFTFMHLLLKAANHMALLIPDKNTKETQAGLARSVCDAAFKECPQFIQQTPTAAFRTLSDPKYCGKMKVLQGLLNAFNANHDKVLIFSYSTRLLDIIEQYVISQGHAYRRIDGKTRSQHRQEIVKRFNSDSSIFLCLISTKAGGLGLNLTGANRVVIFDPNWNPSHDLQAQDRAYRIGQTRDVKVYRLVSAGTIEENIYLRQIYKQQLDNVVIGTVNARRYFHGIQGDKGNRGELFGIKNMFSLRTGDSCLTMDILKRNDKLERGLAGYDITQYVPPNKSLNTDLTEDDENSELGDEHLLDTDSDEEDEEFLRNLFGSERSEVVDIKQTADESHFEAALNDSHRFPNALEAVAMESDSDDDPFSLIPNLYNRPHHQASSTDKAKSSLLAPGISSLSSEKRELLNREPASFTGITFSSRTFRHSDVPLHHSEAAETMQRGALSGISWLFDDSSDEENVNKHNKKRGPETNKSSADFKSNKFGNSLSVTLGPGKTQLSNCTARSIVNSSRNISAETLKANTERTTADMKASTSKENVSLEQLVLTSSDVIHTHANAKVIGSSRAEDHMTNCAMQDVFELRTNSQAPALQCDPYSQEELPEQQKKGRSKPKANNTIIKCSISGSFLLVGQTPAAIKRQQWCELCKSLGMDQLTLARTVLKTDVNKRLDMLREFYSQKHSQMIDTVNKVFSMKQTDHPPEKQQTTNKVRMSHRSKKTGSKNPGASTPRDIQMISDQSNAKYSTHSHKQPSESQSRSAVRQCRVSTSELFDRKNYLSSQTEDSVTAFPTENQDFPPDETFNNFHPKPPLLTRKSSSAAKIVTCKSKIRLRNQRQSNPDINKGNRGKSAKLMKDKNHYSLIGSLLGIDSLDTPSKAENVAGGTGNSVLTDTDMSYNKWDSREHTISYTASRTDHAHAEVETSKLRSCEKANHTESKPEKLSGPNNIAHILDDVFSCLENHTEKQSSPTEELPRNSKYQCNGFNNKAVKSKYSDTPNHSSRLTSDSLFSEEDSVFDYLSKTSTLKDENLGFFNRVGRKRNIEENDKKRPGNKDRGGVTEESKVEADIDDLSWCKFDTHMNSSDSEDRSESLFS